MGVEDRDPAIRAQGRFLVLGPGALDVLRIPNDPVTVDREIELDLTVAGMEVAHSHCRLDVLSSGWHRVVDLESTCTLFVNGLPVDAANLLPFDHRRVGECEFLYPDSPTNPAEVVRVLGVFAPELERGDLEPSHRFRLRPKQARAPVARLVCDQLESDPSKRP